MKPVIQTGDWIVVVHKEWSDELLGGVEVYAPNWYHGNQVAHRFVSGNAKDGFIASGDNNPFSEPKEPVTQDKYVGEIVSIYRVK